MRSKSLTIERFSRLVCCLGISVAACCAVLGQRIAVISPEPDSTAFTANLNSHLAGKFKVLDSSMALTAFRSASPDTPFNMTTEMSRNIGQRIGCDFIILVRTANQRRTSFDRGDYFEGSAAVFVVSARTGNLVLWRLRKSEDAKQAAAASMLDASAAELANEISDTIPDIVKTELKIGFSIPIEEMPLENSPEAKGFRSPVPYKRIKPLYTTQADLFAVTATVDLQLDLDEKGNILRTLIVRWAGYGLDESVTGAVRKMNWRPAERNGKPLPLRVLLRYNFKKIEKDE